MRELRSSTAPQLQLGTHEASGILSKPTRARVTNDVQNFRRQDDCLSSQLFLRGAVLEIITRARASRGNSRRLEAADKRGRHPLPTAILPPNRGPRSGLLARPRHACRLHLPLEEAGSFNYCLELSRMCIALHSERRHVTDWAFLSNGKMT